MARYKYSYGPRNIKLYEVNKKTGNITTHTVNHIDAAVMLRNSPNIFRSRIAAQAFVDLLLNMGNIRDTLVDTTEWVDEDEADINGEDDITLLTDADEEILQILGLEDSVVAPPFPDHLSLKTAQLIAYAYATPRVKDVNEYVLTRARDSEIDAVDAFLSWYHNDFDGLALKMNKPNICKLYKQFLETV